MFTCTGSGIRSVLFDARLHNPAQFPAQLTLCPAQFASKKAHNFHFFSAPCQKACQLEYGHHVCNVIVAMCMHYRAIPLTMMTVGKQSMGFEYGALLGDLFGLLELCIISAYLKSSQNLIHQKLNMFICELLALKNAIQISSHEGSHHVAVVHREKQQLISHTTFCVSVNCWTTVYTYSTYTCRSFIIVPFNNMRTLKFKAQPTKN